MKNGTDFNQAYQYVIHLKFMRICRKMLFRCTVSPPCFIRQFSKGDNMCDHLVPRSSKKFMLNSAEHEILDGNIYKNIKKFNIFKAQISLECYFSCS